MIGDLKEGDAVYVRVEFRQFIDTGAACVWVRNPATHGFEQICVPKSQIVCIEPKAMEAIEDGTVRAIVPPI